MKTYRVNRAVEVDSTVYQIDNPTGGVVVSRMYHDGTVLRVFFADMVIKDIPLTQIKFMSLARMWDGA